ncbi:nuclear pore complex protein Nup88 [Anopheles maculipalpis]|uniref:nuclear pore complex protein Nup88 n=1 Tax=Anopheles maculipalpis TaxID=1496333 RepID=UPI002158E475|nr:nuclear pore complex protein Nup88 [Anopheles maculipalpis]
MATKTDSFGFNDTKLFQVARDCSPDDHKHTQNLVESKDDMLYVWNAKNCCILVLNWRAAASRKKDDLKHQTLIPSAPQNFTVEKILPSTDGTFLALAGPKGVSIIELPRRWGPNGQYQNGKECIICRAYNLDEHLFTENAMLELLQIRWHPASPTDSHLLALLSDNSIRVYDVDSLRHVWRIGPTPTPQAVIGTGGTGKQAGGIIAGSPGNNVSSSGITSKLAYLNSLGDTAVDFDIAPPRVVSSATGSGSGSIGDATFSPTLAGTTTLSTTSSTVATTAKSAITPKEGGALMNDSLMAHKNKKSSTAATAAGVGTKVEWPIVILRGDGNVYVLCAGIDTNRPKLQGPISIQPQVDDNYGLDSCSLIVIPTLPPTVIIAESTGKTHHALFLEESCPLERSLTSELADSNLTMHPCEWYLHVLETVELELGLPSVEETKEAKSYSCPLHLKRDPLNEARYFAYHNAGLHAVTLDFTRPLHEFVQQEYDEELAEKYPLFNSHSRAEYVVCTKALQNANTNAVLGFTLLQSPSGLVLFLASGQVVSLDLITDHSLIRKWPLAGSNKKTNNGESPIKNMLKDSFQKRIHSILKSGLTQPILKLDQTTEPTPQEAFELLTQATRMLRENYFVRHDKARQEIEKREHVLKLLKQQQLNDIEELQAEKQKIRATAERLAETYEDLCDKQNSLFKRAQEVVRLATLRLPKGSFSEKQFAERIEKIHQSVKLLQKNVDQAKQKIATQQIELESNKKTAKEKTITLPVKQENIIKQIIGEMYTQIDSNVKDVKKMNSILNLT